MTVPDWYEETAIGARVQPQAEPQDLRVSSDQAAAAAAVVQAALRAAVPDYEATVAFLRWFAPAGPWLLVGIDPEKQGDTVAQAFTVAEEPKLRAWLERAGATRNLYFTVNPTRWDAPRQKKPARHDIAALAWLHVDLDPDKKKPVAEERARILGVLRNLPAGIPQPSCIVDSGGGYQAFWRLQEPLELAGADAVAREASADAAAAWNRWLEQRLGADRTHNLDRLMRLPGTLNRPDKKKREAGRAVALAQVVEQRDTLHALESFQRAEAKGGATVKREATAKVARSTIPVAAVESLDSVEQIRGNAELRKLLEEGGTHADRSANVMHAAGWMARVGVPEGIQLALLQDARLGISAHVLAQGDPHRAAQRAVEQARQDEASKRARDAAALEAGEFLLGKGGRPQHTIENLELALRKLGVALWYDEFAQEYTLKIGDEAPQEMDDEAVLELRLKLQRQWKLGPPSVVDWLRAIALQDRRHPVREYLAGLKWDGVPRVDAWLSTYLGVEPSSYAREVGRCVLLAAVARVRQPGCKFDEMMILEGPQAVGKSRALRALAGREEWFRDSLNMGGHAESMGARLIEATAGAWICELQELEGMSRADVGELKALLSRQVDRARLAYARSTSKRPRQFIVIGTTNEEEYLKDGTGNRRFWPVKVGTIEVAALARDREQLWAEAAQREAAGEPFLLKAEAAREAVAEQELRLVVDPMVDRLQSCLGSVEDAHILPADAWRLVGIDPGKASQRDKQRLGASLRSLGWERRQRRDEAGLRMWIYSKGTGARRVTTPGIVDVLVDGVRVSPS